MSTAKRSQREARWRAIIKRQMSGGLGVPGFCRREGLALSTFHWWRRRLESPVRDKVQWIEAQGSAQLPSVPALLEQNALSGHLFVFCNATRTRIKILYWDGTGLWLLTKRLERGRYAWPAAAAEAAAEAAASAPRRLTLPHRELLLLLSGIDLSKTQRRDWWRRE